MAKPKVKVQFTRNYLVKDAEGTSYNAGDIVELSEDSARHFIIRGAAVRVHGNTDSTGPTAQSTPDLDAVRGVPPSQELPPEEKPLPRSAFVETEKK